ncbi:hypothetical protein SUGI_1006850 [Cryptomeria japonica]|uniref:protein VACUOLELESS GAMETOPHYTES isoform X2 n=1 Tax=Cryptomeria japonica TaxID=3369 RepID=UPI002414724D|nr:protein VACUOLELESS GAMETOPHYTES isoform X2 [Cryptomeria japonica]GLJ47674.1 hypothetical protein SUGI_1006850 [Cryptomeria japonica]
MQQVIQHPSHPGHWLSYARHPPGYICDICREDLEGKGYRCDACDFDLHISCATVNTAEQKVVQHPSHPGHSLSYFLCEGGYTCSCCGKDGGRHGYRCAACKFYLKITCATVRMAKERPIQHPSHPEHLLSYVGYPYGFSCDGCGKRVHGNGYRCAACNFDLHECCATAPRVLHHSFHGGNGIWVQFQKRPPGESQMSCSYCAQIVSGFGYYCLSGSCGYALHPTCALLLQPQTQVEVAPTRPTQVETPPPPPEKDHHHRGAAMAFRGGKFLGKLAVGAITGDPTSIGGALADLFLSD